MRNKFEKAIALQLKRAKVVFKYEPCRVPYVIAGHYIPDFVIDTDAGRIYLECKGYFRPEAKRKLLAVKRANPHIDLRILFYAANKSNIRWAEKNGIKYAISIIPQEWLNGL